jgi:multiple sugar transport system permease protein
MLIAFIISFTDYGIDHLFDSTFVGIENYVDLFTNQVKYDRFWRSIGTTMSYIVLTVPMSIILTLIVSAMLNSKIKGEKFFKTIFYIPSVTVGVAIMVMRKEMLATDGLINQIFNTDVDFLYSKDFTNLLMIGIMGIRGGLGYNVLIMLSAMKNIDRSLYEAAEIDGAGPIEKFFSITLPNVMPTIFFFIVTGLIGGFQVGEQMLILYGDSSSNTYISTFIYKLYYVMRRDGDYGVASAMSYILFVVILLFTVLQFKLQNDSKSKKKKGGNKDESSKAPLPQKI